MNWWRPYAKRDAAKEQLKAEKALELSELSLEVLDGQRKTLEELIPPLQEHVSVLARINRENNFGARLAAAYRGGH